MKILLVSSEVVPFAKTGGLADVCGALPIELQKLGHEVIVIQPYYQATHQCPLPKRQTDITIDVTIGSKIVSGQLWKSNLPDSDVPVYLVQQDEYFDRDGIYQSNGQDFKDNCERFVFFCRFTLELLAKRNWFPDLIHCNDWQTALIPAYLKTVYADQPGYKDIGSLMTIHNIAFQGNFWHWDMLLTGINWKHFNWREMEFYGQLNLLKTGLVFADGISTVSPRYSHEIQTREQGFGLESVLQERRASLTGILNGIDTQVWNPLTDPMIAANYSVSDWQNGKAECKADLQASLNLPNDPQVPLMGIVGRLAGQKGWSLIVDVMESWLQSGRNTQWAILGTGDPDYEQKLHRLKSRFPHNIGLALGFSNEMAHKIEAGSDMFLMPSRYEPCGLNQMYSMQYGTIPVVHETGGLADTVVNADHTTLENGTANGFSFSDWHAQALANTLGRAIEMFQHSSSDWTHLVENGMNHDWSWTASAQQYQQLYESIVQQRQHEQRELNV